MSIPPNRLVLGPLSGGLQTYDKPFYLNNESFPVLDNALCWRHQLIKKQGSEQLGRLQLTLDTALMGATTITVTVTRVPPVSAGNPIQPGISQFSVGSIVYSDATITAGGDPITLIASDGSMTSTFDRTTGQAVLHFPALAGNTPVQYFPGLPVMGIENFESDNLASTQIDVTNNVYFDTVYSYVFNGTIFTNNSYYKITGTPVYWTGQNYQQFYTSNYYRAMWVTNNNPGAQFVFGAYSAGTGTSTITFNFKDKNGGNNITTLIVGDVIWFNEWNAGGSNINGLSGSVTDATGAAAGNYIVTFASSVTVAGTGIAQLMTSSVSGQGDGIRWYDGQGPGALGFVNFAPPLDNLATSATTYLVGCRIIIPFGNRLLAIGSFEATSSQIFASLGTTFSGDYYGNRIRYCEVSSTPFYSAPVPNGFPPPPAIQPIEPKAWASAGIQGFGGFIDLDTTQRIISANVTQGSMILGLEAEQRRMSNTGIEVDPFSLQVINPEYGTAGTHAFVPMDKGILTAGEYGFIIASSYDAQRFDIPIIQQIFQVNPVQNAYERICGGRDFVNEVVYFSFNSIFNQEDTGSNPNTFPDTTLVYNYRENSFALWNETPTTYGLIKLGQKTWSALTDIVWETWNTPWNSQTGVSNYPFVGIGTPQGFVLLKWANPSTNDGSLTIQNIVMVTPDVYTITSVNHNLSAGMYVGFSLSGNSPSFIGQITNLGDSSGASPIALITVNFDLSNPTTIPANIVPGTWEMSIVDQPFIQTKQFQFAWSNAKKTRIGAQKYFLDTTDDGEFTVEILGSQSPVPLNNSTVGFPEPSLISRAIVRTRPDDSLGINGSQANQTQIWHRLASSVIGDTVQLQISFSDAQMRNVDIATSPWVLHSAILDLYPSRTLA